MEGTKLLSNQALVHTKGYMATERSFLPELSEYPLACHEELIKWDLTIAEQTGLIGGQDN